MIGGYLYSVKQHSVLALEVLDVGLAILVDFQDGMITAYIGIGNLKLVTEVGADVENLLQSVNFSC